jgi:hypothetical protein
MNIDTISFRFPQFYHVLFEYLGNVKDVMALADTTKFLLEIMREKICFNDMLNLIATINLPRLLRAYPGCKLEEFLTKYNGVISGSAAVFLLNPSTTADFSPRSDLDIYIPMGERNGNVSFYNFDNSKVVISNKGSMPFKKAIIDGQRVVQLDTRQLHCDLRKFFNIQCVPLIGLEQYDRFSRTVDRVFSIVPKGSLKKIDVVISSYGLSALHTIMDFDFSFVSNCIVLDNGRAKVICGDIRAVAERKIIFNSEVHRSIAVKTASTRLRKYLSRGFSYDKGAFKEYLLYNNIKIQK